jgi:hypothetical protein
VGFVKVTQTVITPIVNARLEKIMKAQILEKGRNFDQHVGSSLMTRKYKSMQGRWEQK